MTALHSPTLQQQRALDLPATDADLKRAYDRCGLKHHGISFEEATEDPAIRIALKNLAHALQRRTPRFKWGRR